MRGAWLAILTACAIGGCSNEGTVASPREGQTPSPAMGNQSEGQHSDIVEKVGTTDYTQYGIPIYPGAKIDEGASLATREQKGAEQQVQVTLDSTGDVPSIANCYKDQIKASNALSSIDLATLAGTTQTGYGVSITVAKVDTKSVISITVDQSSKK